MRGRDRIDERVDEGTGLRTRSFENHFGPCSYNGYKKRKARHTFASLQTSTYRSLVRGPLADEREGADEQNKDGAADGVQKLHLDRDGVSLRDKSTGRYL